MSFISDELFSDNAYGFFDIRLDYKKQNYGPSIFFEIDNTKNALNELIKLYNEKTRIEDDASNITIQEPEKKSRISKVIFSLSGIFNKFKDLFKKTKKPTVSGNIIDEYSPPTELNFTTDAFKTNTSDQHKFEFIFTFWLTSIKKEVDFAMAKLTSFIQNKIPLTHEKLTLYMKSQTPEDSNKLLLNVALSLNTTLSNIFPEFLSMIEFSSPFKPYGYQDSKTSKTYYSNFDILIFYQLIGNQYVYIGSIFYKCWNQPGWEYSLGNFTDGKQKWMLFISIYKSLLNDCTVCGEKKYNKFMLDKVESIARNEDCEFMGTIPLGIMGKILISEGFSFNYTKLLKKGGGKKTKPNRSRTGKKLNNLHKTNNKSKRKK
jgi:hypothetical protein